METIGTKVAAALVRAQREFGPALKDKTNPAFRSRYADLGNCLDAVMDALNNAGIMLMQRTHPHEGGVAVETVFVHESGETLSAGVFVAPAVKQDPQGYGSATTYARRYSLMAACGIAPEDDDGNAAAVAKPRQSQAAETRAGLDASRLHDWLQAIASADAADLDGVKREALEAAQRAKDREAWIALRDAAKARADELAAGGA